MKGAEQSALFSFMRTRSLAVIILVLVAAATRSGAQQPTFPSRVDLVTVDAVVFDRGGNPVQDLRAEDFTVREDGVRQQVTAFDAIALPPSPPTLQGRMRVSTNEQRPDAAGRWFFIVFDDMNVTQYATPRARDTIAQFIERVLRPGDRVMIALSSSGFGWTGELPQDRDALLERVRQLQGARRMENTPDRIWDHEAMAITLKTDPQAQAQVARRFFENDIIPEAGAAPSDPTLRRDLDVSPGIALIQAKARQTYREAQTRIQASLGGLDRISAALASARGRKSLFFFSEGFIPDTTLPASAHSCKPHGTQTWPCISSMSEARKDSPASPVWRAAAPTPQERSRTAMRRRHWRWRPAMRTEHGRSPPTPAAARLPGRTSSPA